MAAKDIKMTATNLVDFDNLVSFRDSLPEKCSNQIESIDFNIVGYTINYKSYLSDDFVYIPRAAKIIADNGEVTTVTCDGIVANIPHGKDGIRKMRFIG